MCLIIISNATVIVVCHGQAGNTQEAAKEFFDDGMSVEDQPICRVQFKYVSRTDNLIFLFL